MEIKGREKVMAIVAGAVILLVAVDSFVVEPLIKSWKSRSEKIVALEKSIEQGRSILDRESVLRSRWEQMSTNALPGNVSAAESELFKSFDRWSQSSGAAVSSIKPEFKEGDTNYAELQCRADITGDVGTLRKFLYDMEKDPMGLKIYSAQITSRDDNGQQIALALEVSGLILNPPPPSQ